MQDILIPGPVSLIYYLLFKFGLPKQNHDEVLFLYRNKFNINLCSTNIQLIKK